MLRRTRDTAMRIGIPRELKPREGRVGLIPAACVELVRGGHEVFVEHGAGEKSGYSDQTFRDVGVTVLPTADELFDEIPDDREGQGAHRARPQAIA